MSAVIYPFTKELQQVKHRRVAESDQPAIFTDIYREDTNIVVWQRQLSMNLQRSVDEFISSNADLHLVTSVTPKSVYSTLDDSLFDINCKEELSKDITELVEMFCDLFDLKEVGLRLRTLDKAMCPRFHYDRVPCRLVSTYHGVATEWLPHNVVDRSKLGPGNNGLCDEKSGLFQSKQDIKKINTGDVALLKGELWEGNENAGLVHRSPAVEQGQKRLLLTLDFI